MPFILYTTAWTLAVLFLEPAPTVKVNVEDDAVVSDVVTVTAMPFSEAGVARVEFSVDDQLRATVPKPRYEYKWDTVDENEGAHRLIVSVFDGDGKAATKRIKVEVDNGLSKGIKHHANTAIALFRLGEFDKALLAGRKAYKIDIANPDAIRALAAGVGGKGDLNRAIDLLEKPQMVNNQVIGDPKSYPMSDRVALELRGAFRIQRAAKQTTAAAMIPDLATAYDFWRKLTPTYLSEVRAANPDPEKNPGTLFAVGDSLFYHADYEGALALYQKAPSAGKTGVIRDNRIAITNLRMGRLKAAEQLLLSMVNESRANDATRAILGAVLISQHRYAKARAELDGPIQRGSLMALVVGAHADLGIANYRRAFDELKQAMDKAPSLPETHYLAASFFTDTGDFKRATDYLFSGLQLDPGLLDAYTLRGFQLAAMAPTDGPKQAVAVFDFVLQRDPQQLAARVGKAVMLMQQKQYRAAEALLGGVSRDDRSAADVLVASAVLFANGTEQQRATDALAQARKLEPERFPDTLVPQFGDLIRRIGRYRRVPLITPAILEVEEG
jgi:tetratricopeptide (TPR) repeat protein